MDYNHIKLFIAQVGDPLHILNLQPGASKKEVKSAYKEMARIHHPDKTQHATSDMFIKIKKAADFLQDDANSAAYHKYLATLKLREEELSHATLEARLFANDLLKRENEAEKKRQQEQAQQELRRQELLNQMEKERKEYEKQKQDKEQAKIKFNLQHSDEYKRLNSVKVKWREGNSFNKSLLRLVFTPCGPI